MKYAAIQHVFQPISSRNDLMLKASAAERSLVLLIMKQQHLFITPLRAGSRLSIPSLTVPLLFGWQWVTPGLQRYIEVVRVSVRHGDQLREKHLPSTSPQTYSWMRRLLLTWWKTRVVGAVSRHSQGVQQNHVFFLIIVLIQLEEKGLGTTLVCDI